MTSANDLSARLASLSGQKQELLRRLSAERERKASADRPLSRRPAGTSFLPLSHVQRGLWFLARLVPDNPVYTMPYAVHLAGPLDVGALEQSFNALVRRHEALRTVFPEIDGTPRQLVLSELSLPVPVIDLSDTPGGPVEGRALRMASEEGRRPFDVAEGPLLRVVLYRLGSENHLLMFAMHHIISDGWSVGIMMREIAAAYDAFHRGLPDPLGELAIQYGDYTLWHHDWLRGGALESQLAYWRRQLDGVTPLNLPIDFPRPAVQRFHGGMEEVSVSQSMTAALEALGREQGATLFMTLLAAFQVALFLLSGTERVVVGTPVANRRRPELEPLIGLFANSLALCTDCSGNPSFVDLLGRVRDVTLGAFAHQDVPFEVLVDALQVERDSGRNPLFQVMFGLQSVSVHEFSLPGLTATPRQLEHDSTHFDLELQLWHRDGCLGGYLSYDRDLFEPDTIIAMRSTLMALLDLVVQRPDESLAVLGSAIGLDRGAETGPRHRDGGPVSADDGPRSIEAALLKHPAVEDCAVLRRVRGGTGEWVAYVVPAQAVSVDALQTVVKARVPTSRQPAAIVVIPSMPITPDGGIDETALLSVPVIDAETAARCEHALRSRTPGLPVKVVAEEGMAPRPLLHVSALLPERMAADAPRPVRTAPASVTEETASIRLAVSDGGPLHIPPGTPPTLSEALHLTAARRGDQGIVFVDGEGTTASFLSYAELLQAARGMLAGLQAQGLVPGDRVILQLADPADHFTCFWACVLGGIVPVTVALAPSYRQKGSVVSKLWNVWKLLGRPVILTNAVLAPELGELPALFAEEGIGNHAFRLIEAERLKADPATARIHRPVPEDVVFLQLTSGSTGIPKCVQETHRAIVHHIHGSSHAVGYRPDDVSLNWLPFDHVVPILTWHLRDVYLGMRQVQVGTATILADPLKWLDLIEAHRVTHAWAPNFGFKLLNDRLSRESSRRWDLSSIKFFMNAGEQVTLPVVREFLHRLAPFGVAAGAMQPAFGMAEAATCMTYHNGFDPAGGHPPRAEVLAQRAIGDPAGRCGRRRCHRLRRPGSADARRPDPDHRPGKPAAAGETDRTVPDPGRGGDAGLPGQSRSQPRGVRRRRLVQFRGSGIHP